MKIFIYNDELAHKNKNQNGEDYSASYIPVMLKNLGFTAEKISEKDIVDGKLSGNDVIFTASDVLSDKCADEIAKAAEKGCTVIAFATEGKIFPKLSQPQAPLGKYEIAGYFYFNDETPLPLTDKFFVAEGYEGQSDGFIKAKNGEKYASALRLGENIYYFTFDLPVSLKTLGDGKPTDKATQVFHMGRVPDACILEYEYDYSIAYADVYMEYITNVLTKAGMPRIFQLEPNGGKAAELVIYLGGDDDASDTNIDLVASDVMYERGLPYHMNLMPCGLEGGFVLTKEQFDAIRERGHDFAIHYDFTKFPYTLEGHKIQTQMYEERFGEKTVCPVNHCVIQHGTTHDRWRMQIECGAIADNNRIQTKLDYSDINAFNIIGYAFGSAFPRFVADDAAHGNAELDFCELYSSYYEPRIHNDEAWEFEKVEGYLNEAKEKARTSQLFIHPHYISNIWMDSKPALKALDHATAYIKEKGWNVVYCTPDHLAYWWHDRAKCSFENVTENGFTVKNPSGRDFTVVLPLGVSNISTSACLSHIEEREISGKKVKLLTLKGEAVTVKYTK